MLSESVDLVKSLGFGGTERGKGKEGGRRHWEIRLKFDH